MYISIRLSNLGLLGETLYHKFVFDYLRPIVFLFFLLAFFFFLLQLEIGDFVHRLDLSQDPSYVLAPSLGLNEPFVDCYNLFVFFLRDNIHTSASFHSMDTMVEPARLPMRSTRDPISA